LRVHEIRWNCRKVAIYRRLIPRRYISREPVPIKRVFKLPDRGPNDLTDHRFCPKLMLIKTASRSENTDLPHLSHTRFVLCAAPLLRSRREFPALGHHTVSAGCFGENVCFNTALRRPALFLWNRSVVMFRSLGRWPSGCSTQDTGTPRAIARNYFLDGRGRAGVGFSRRLPRFEIECPATFSNARIDRPIAVCWSARRLTSFWISSIRSTIAEAFWLGESGLRFDFFSSSLPSSNPDSNSDRVTPSTLEILDRFPKLMFFSPRSIWPM